MLSCELEASDKDKQTAVNGAASEGKHHERNILETRYFYAHTILADECVSEDEEVPWDALEKYPVLFQLYFDQKK